MNTYLTNILEEKLGTNDFVSAKFRDFKEVEKIDGYITTFDMLKNSLLKKLFIFIFIVFSFSTIHQSKILLVLWFHHLENPHHIFLPIYQTIHLLSLVKFPTTKRTIIYDLNTEIIFFQLIINFNCSIYMSRYNECYNIIYFAFN